MTKEKTIARINQVDIVEVETDGEIYVAIKPICEALGISHQSQNEKIKNDEILSSVVTLSMTTGADGKSYQMTTIPYRYIFGWLFTINSKNVNAEAAETVNKYKRECYDALYNHFFLEKKFLKEKETAIESQLVKVQEIKRNFKATKENLTKAEKDLLKIRSFTFDDYRANNSQLSFSFYNEIETVNQQED